MVAGLAGVLVFAAIGTTVVPVVATGLFPPTAAGLSHTWTCRYPYATETISLGPAGVCAQRIAFDSGRVINNVGHWSFRSSSHEVQLTGVTVVDNAFGLPRADLSPTSGLWCMMARRAVTGSEYLVVNEDLNVYFRQ